jgi:hypothetical protein
MVEPQGGTLCLVEFDVLCDQGSVRYSPASAQLFLAPAIQEVACARRTREILLDLRRFGFNECLGFLVACVTDDR